MNFKSLLGAGAACLVAGAAGSASAATVTMTATADLTLAEVSATSIRAGNYFSQADALPLATPLDVAEGDTFIVEVDFLGNQILTVEDLGMAWSLVITKDNAQADSINMTGMLELLGLDGSVVLASVEKTNTDSAIHISQVFNGGDFGSPASVTFAGFRYTGVVNDYATFTTRTYDGPSLWFDGSSVTVGEGQVGVVPEPGTWALMILGFGAAGSMLRRRTACAA